jgi:cob(I)alamin adenosyltransferase
MSEDTNIDSTTNLRQGYGLIQLFTGNGKGKTTAALGEAIRAFGAGKKVGIVYFDKGGTHYSERAALDRLAMFNRPAGCGDPAYIRASLPLSDAESSTPASLPISEGELGGGEIAYLATGRDRIDPTTGQFDFSINDADKVEARRGLAAARFFFDKACDLVVLDEINVAASIGLVSPDDVLALIDAKPERTEVILTGRNAPESILARAHLVTEMLERKHYFHSGVKAREGIEY